MPPPNIPMHHSSSKSNCSFSHHAAYKSYFNFLIFQWFIYKLDWEYIWKLFNRKNSTHSSLKHLFLPNILTLHQILAYFFPILASKNKPQYFDILVKYWNSMKMQEKLFLKAGKQCLHCNKLFLNSAQVRVTIFQTKISFKNRKRSYI